LSLPPGLETVGAACAHVLLTPEPQAKLMAAGRLGSTPVAVVENGSRPDERVLTGRLDGLGALVRGADLSGPALLFVGETAAFSAAQLDVRAEVAA